MANNISYAEIFQAALDEQMLTEMTSGWMEANAGQVRYNGGNTVKVSKMTLTGLGTYSRSTGYPTSGAVTLSWETFTFSMDRGQKFNLDSQDVDESNFVASAGTVMSEFQRTKVAPEVDAYRYSTIFNYANNADKVDSYTPATSDIFEELSNDIATVQDVIGDNEPLVIMMRTPVAAYLDQADKIEKKLDVVNFTAGEITTKVRGLDGVPIVRIPTARFKSSYTFSATDGFSADATAMNINWIIAARRSLIAIVKQDAPKIINPEVNQSYDGWSIFYRKYHDIWIFDNKIEGVYVSYTPITAPALTATVASGTGTGNTKFTAAAGSGNTLYYSLSAAAATANFNDQPSGLTGPYTSGADIAATAGQYLNMYELDSNLRVVKFLSAVLASGDIS